ncbi:MAG: DUF1667 domain-containing protein [Clostridia bacterium]|nr:DUF1667 domain-containing protein [Clostridia bacterium]
MNERTVTCIECPVGCEIKVVLSEKNVVSVSGNGCNRGKMYAENEVVCPRRVVTSTVRSERGTPVPVKTERPVKKDEIFSVMKKINSAVCRLPVKIGDVVVKNISEDIDLIATANID